MSAYLSWTDCIVIAIKVRMSFEDERDKGRIETDKIDISMMYVDSTMRDRSTVSSDQGIP